MAHHALIIEDEVLIALEVEQVLTELGFKADSPSRAVNCARLQRPDLVTADLRIVSGTGIEAVRAIQSGVGTVPVIYITANMGPLRDEPNATVVSKPILPHRMRVAIEAVS